MKKGMTVDDIEQLRDELRQTREQSLTAARQNDFRAVARLTAETARLNRAIQAQESFVDCSPKVLAVVDSLAQIDDESHFVFPEEPVLQLDSSNGWSEAA